MAEALEREIRFDISPALGDLQTLDSAFEDLFGRVQAGLSQAIQDGIADGLTGEPAEVEVEADTTDAQAEVDALAEGDLIEIPVAADTGDAEAEIDAVVAEGESEEIVIPVSVDTGGAEQDLDALGESAEGAAGGANVLGGAVAGLTQKFTAAAPSAGATGGALAALGPQGAVAAGGIAATVGGLTLLAKRGIDVLEIQQQFNDTFGESADAVREIDVAGLNTDLEELSLSLGADDELLLAATTRAGAFAKTLGLGRVEVAGFAEDVVALGAFVSSVNPQLGSIDQVVNQIARTLSRSPQGLGRLGLDVDPNRVAALAAELGKLPEELTRGERAAISARAALEGVGDASDDVARRQGNAGVILRSTLERIQDLIEDVAVPVAIPIVEALGSLGPLLTGLSPLARIFGQGISLALRATIIPLAEFAQIFGDITQGIGEFVEEANQVAGLGRLVPDELGDSLIEFGGNLSDSAAETRRLAEEGGGLESSMEDVADSVPPASGVVDEFGTSAEDAVPPVTDLEKAIDELAESAVSALPTAADALGAFTGGIEEAFGDLVSAQESAETATQSAAETVADAQAALEEARRDALTSGPDGAEAAAQRIQEATDAVTAAQGELLLTTQAGTDEVAAAEDRLAAATDPQRFIDNLNEQTLSIVGFQNNLRTLLNQGRDDLVAFLLEQGPEQGAALAQSLVNDPALAEAANLAVVHFGDAVAANKDFAKLRGAELVGSLTTGIEEEATAKRPTVDDKIREFFGGTAGIATEGGKLSGIGFVLGVGRGLNDPDARKDVDDAVAGVGFSLLGGLKNLLGISSPSRVAQELAGEVVAGIALGLAPTPALEMAADALAVAAIPQLDPSAFSVSIPTLAAAALPAAAGAAAPSGDVGLPGAGRSVVVQGPLVGEVHNEQTAAEVSAELAWTLGGT